MNALFITGTDTDIGKTTVTVLLTRFLSAKNYNAIAQKWIETGRSRKDRETLLSPYIFKYPASPHLAARLEDRKVDPGKIENAFNTLKKRADFIIVEGTGGALVPYSDKRFIIDITRKLKIPVLIVAENKLGAINHTLLTIEALRRRNIKIIGIIFNNKQGAPRKVLKDNIRIIEKLSGIRSLGCLERMKSHEKLFKKFRPIGKNILEKLEKNG